MGRKADYLENSWQLGPTGQIDSASRLGFKEGVEEFYDFGPNLGEDGTQIGQKWLVRGIVGPKAENASGMDLLG